MAKARTKKQQEISHFLDRSKSMRSAILIRFLGLSVKQERELRKQLRDQQCEMQVVKKTLLRKALTELKIDFDQLGDTSGSFAIVFGMADEVVPAKILQMFAKKNKTIELSGGIYNGELIDKARVIILANLPSHTQLLGQLVNLIASPLAGVVRVLSAPMRDMVGVLRAIQEKQTT